MVVCICVRGSTLARLAMVLVWHTSGKPSTWFPLGGLVEQQTFPSLFFFKQKTAYEISACLVGSEMCIRDSTKTVAKRARVEPRTQMHVIMKC